MSITPSIFIGHGSPTTIAGKGAFQTDIAKYAQSLDNLQSILVVSAHWEQSIPLQVTYSTKPEIIYDFYGFPEEMYRIKYDVGGNPSLAKKIANTLNSNGIKTQLNKDRGLDHGAWIPLSLMFPKAQNTVIQLSIPVPRTPEKLFKIGRSLKHLRHEGVLLTGSGNLIHNLGYVMSQARMGKIDFNNLPNAPVEEWALKVDDWIKNKLTNLEIEDLLDSQNKISNFKMVAPTTEHFDPIYFILGTMMPGDSINHFHESIHGGSLSMRCFGMENKS